ncbi:MAG: sulfotransferase [Sphingobium sp.]|nr:MAG: sulfotransferase [Sphingobium sp.]
MEHIDPPVRRPYGARRHLASLFGVRLLSDIPERLCELGVRPWLGGKRRARLRSIRAAGALFIHVPKNAGMSVSEELYGRQIKHATIRYYQRVAPDIPGRLPTFAILRDPVDRFLSAYAYARAGGSAHNSIALPFRDAYRAFRSIDDAIDHLRGAPDIYAVDHIFRPQSWYVTDAVGRVAVDRLFLIDEMDRLGEMTPLLRGVAFPHLNRGAARKPLLNARQIDALSALYADDLRLIAGLRAARTAPVGRRSAAA